VSFSKSLQGYVSVGSSRFDRMIKLDGSERETELSLFPKIMSLVEIPAELSKPTYCSGQGESCECGDIGDVSK